tara:strand:- start:185 stop:670 length:486 start_codon:yes stop_codon:yes gene_type:complete
MLKISAVFLAFALLSGCSTIVSDSIYPVSITSSPSQADFVLKNREGKSVHSGMTPETVTLNASSGFFKGETYTLILNKDGFDQRTIEIQSSVDGWYFGNILLGGWLGMLIIDPATGAMFKLPENANASLNEAVTAKTEAGITITMLDSVSEKEKSNLVPIK